MRVMAWIGVTLLAVSPAVMAQDAGLLAFPGAEGFGRYAKGGRGGAVLFVTNLSDYRPGEEVIPGSLRAAVEAEGARTVVFRVSGTIELKGTLSIREPYITVAGQTAPGDGICVRNYGVSVQTHDVIVRHIRCRPGDEVGRLPEYAERGWSTDALSLSGAARDVILDHCSTSWANDEVLSVSGAGITGVTVQWCIISESLNASTHHKGSHGYGSLIRTNGTVSFHHNLYAFHSSRSPRPGTYGDGSILFDFRNNVMHAGGQGYSADDPVRMNFVANYHPTTPFSANPATTYYADSNFGDITGDGAVPAAYAVAPVVTTTASEAYTAVLDAAGAVLPARDAVDARVVDLVRKGVETQVDSAEEVGGWPTLHATASPADSDDDGMPDGWEVLHALDPDAPDSNADSDSDGYTNLEEFLNGTDPTRP
ncbi:pectate lyase [Candidatus Poribacteria bacterium]|nr:pectate lyase [Candidatus Poribacteria bacterium]MBT5532453.1 pectate lyase [Candidatus Poribacteria bacterium]MBT5709750.1 pectate lyase [Candidatus Poribacteria bacterium]MBT7101838.1 pectate lyase [Candidatus Poribacteria bacterium]MBT7807010.1 pectate lyase [Candidatus Poribacteria bacterium]